MWLDMVSPSDRRMEIASRNDAQVHLYVASCPPEVALERAFDRATKAGKNMGRFVPTFVVLNGHRQVSLKLPRTLSLTSCVLQLFDTSSSERSKSSDLKVPLLIASSNGYDSNLEIIDAVKFVEFVRKAALNPHALNPTALYNSHNGGEQDEGWTVARTLSKFVEDGMILNFQYPEVAKSDKNGGGGVSRHFAHISSVRAHIGDFAGLIRHLGGPTVSEKFLQLLITRIKVRNIKIIGPDGMKLIVGPERPIYLSVPSRESSEKRILTNIHQMIEGIYGKTTQ
jgi:hypothetical protein